MLFYMRFMEGCVAKWSNLLVHVLSAGLQSSTQSLRSFVVSELVTDLREPKICRIVNFQRFLSSKLELNVNLGVNK